MKRFRILSLLINVVMLMILPLQIFAEGESSGVSGDTTVNAETSEPADETLSEDGNAREYSADEITAKQQNTEDPQAADNEMKSGTQNTDTAESVSEATVPSAVSENTQSTDAKAASPVGEQQPAISVSSGLKSANLLAAESDEEEEEEKKRKWSKLLGLIPAIGSVILFILTEDIRLPWRWIDKWTIWMIIILLVNVILAFLTRNKKKDDDEEEEEEPARA